MDGTEVLHHALVDRWDDSLGLRRGDSQHTLRVLERRTKLQRDLLGEDAIWPYTLQHIISLSGAQPETMSLIVGIKGLEWLTFVTHGPRCQSVR